MVLLKAQPLLDDIPLQTANSGSIFLRVNIFSIRRRPICDGNIFSVTDWGRFCSISLHIFLESKAKR